MSPIVTTEILATTRIAMTAAGIASVLTERARAELGPDAAVVVCEDLHGRLRMDVRRRRRRAPVHIESALVESGEGSVRIRENLVYSAAHAFWLAKRWPKPALVRSGALAGRLSNARRMARQERDRPAPLSSPIGPPGREARAVDWLNAYCNRTDLPRLTFGEWVAFRMIDPDA